MSKAYIIHGAYGNPEENWFPWLKEQLKTLGHEVFVPRFPTPEGQSLENWVEAFGKQELDEQTILIGHSIGPAFLLRIIEQLDRPVKACFFVAGFIELLGNETFDALNKSFVERKFDWEKIRNNSKQFFIFHSDNDPYVPLKEGERLAKELGVEIILVKGAGHFNKDAGYEQFPELLEKIKTIL